MNRPPRAGDESQPPRMGLTMKGLFILLLAHREQLGQEWPTSEYAFEAEDAPPGADAASSKPRSNRAKTDYRLKIDAFQRALERTGPLIFGKSVGRMKDGILIFRPARKTHRMRYRDAADVLVPAAILASIDLDPPPGGIDPERN